MKISIFILAFNEEVILPFTINHYRNKFPECHITVFDNQSTDKTKEIALANNCKVIVWDTNNYIDDEKMKSLKNNCWKQANTDWVCIIDSDELVDINEEQLKIEETKNTTIIRSIAYNMVNMENNYDLSNIKYGVRAEMYDKNYLFNKKFIKEIHYNHGAHHSNPMGNIKYSDTKYNLYHYKFISEDFNIARHHYTIPRLSELNKKMGWGTQWHKTNTQIIQEIKDNRKIAIKVKE